MKTIGKKSCSVEGCKRKYDAKGFCHMHYNRWKRHGNPLIITKDMSKNKSCKIVNCNKTYKGLGFCTKHYQRFKKWGDPLFVTNNQEHEKLCAINNCSRAYSGKGYCKVHNSRYFKYGDAKPEIPIKSMEKHGKSYIPEHKIWDSMKGRCNNTRDNGWKNYGGRGIQVCERWNESFSAFYEDVGARPTPKHSIDRIDNDKNYSCGKCNQCVKNGWTMNCRWATRSIQKYNQRLSKKNTSSYRGVGMHLDSRKRIKWTASIRKDKRGYWLGTFATVQEAAKAYDEKARELFGEFARLNFPRDGEMPAR